MVQITDAQVFGPGNLFAVAPGALASLAGPLAQVTGPSAETSVLGAGANVLDVQGRLETTGGLPLFVIDPTTVVAANLISVGPGGNLVLSGTGVATFKASKNIQIAGHLATENGAIVLENNQQAVRKIHIEA
jgi:hypothetical protein